MAHVEALRINGEANIGLMIYANDKFALVGKSTDEKTIKIIKDILKVPCYKVSIAGTHLIGVFLNGTETDVLVPEIIYDKELEELNKIGKEHDVKFHVLNSELTCLGNNILIGSETAILNPDYTEEECKKVEELLGLKIIQALIADIEIIGATAVINYDKKRALVHRDASDSDIELLKTELKVEIETGSVNMGSPYVKSGIVCNKNGFLIGSESGGPEITNADEVLGFLDEE